MAMLKSYPFSIFIVPTENGARVVKQRRPWWQTAHERARANRMKPGVNIIEVPDPKDN